MVGARPSDLPTTDLPLGVGGLFSKSGLVFRISHEEAMLTLHRPRVNQIVRSRTARHRWRIQLRCR